MKLHFCYLDDYKHGVSIPERVLEALKQDFGDGAIFPSAVSIPERVLEALKHVSES